MTTSYRLTFKSLAIFIGSVLALAATSAFSMEHGAMDHVQNPSAAVMTEGEVRKIDTVLGQVTIKHGDIKNLDMPGMTMVYTAKDKALLSGLKVGDKIRFAAEKENGKLMLTAIEVHPPR